MEEETERVTLQIEGTSLSKTPPPGLQAFEQESLAPNPSSLVWAEPDTTNGLKNQSVW